MAQVTLVPAITECIVGEIAPEKVIVTLTREEAVFLRSIFGSMTGSNRHVGTIYRALAQVIPYRHRVVEPQGALADPSRTRVNLRRTVYESDEGWD